MGRGLRCEHGRDLLELVSGFSFLFFRLEHFIDGRVDFFCVRHIMTGGPVLNDSKLAQLCQLLKFNNNFSIIYIH